MRTLVAGLLYFVAVFGAGLVLGPLRILFLVPRLGERWAELAELPVMLAVIVLAARWIVRLAGLPPRAAVRLGVGAIALAAMLAAEFGMVLPLRGLTLEAYLASRDPVSGTAYYVALLVLAVMPALVGRGPRPGT